MAELVLDTTDPFHARVAARLRDDRVIWFVTVGASGAPSPNPVWFLWDGGAHVDIGNLPTAARVGHVSANPRVALHFDADAGGDDVVVLAGTAQVLRDGPRPDAVPEYLAKYATGIPALGLTPQAFAQTYSLPIRVTLNRVRGF